MTPRAWLNMAAFAAIGTAFTVAALLIPSEQWTSVIIVAVLLFGAAIGFVFYIPRMKGNRGNAATFASLGPWSVLSCLLLAWSAMSIAAALKSYSNVSWAMDAITIGGFIVAWSMLQVTSHIVSKAAQMAETPSAHGVWLTKVNSLASACPDNRMKQQVATLAENIRFAARDTPGHEVPENARITTLLGSLGVAVEAGDMQTVTALIQSIQAVLTQREHNLKSLRTRI